MLISIVVAARNDNYGGDFSLRLKNFLLHCGQHCRTLGTSVEILVVEWNPIATAPSLASELTGLAPSGLVRVITVPPEVHNALEGSEKSPMFEYRAKNVGIRRSLGDYLLVTNPDVLFSSRLHRWLAHGKFRKCYFYRADRYDLAPGYPGLVNSAAAEEWCADHWEQVLTYWGTVRRSELKQRLRNEIAYRTLPLRGGARAHPHCHASGDFMMMHRDHWFQLHGFSEAPYFAHLDSLMVFGALSAGLKQKVHRGSRGIYHQFHTRFEQKERPGAALADIYETGRRAVREKRLLTSDNATDWGLGSVQLLEQRL